MKLGGVVEVDETYIGGKEKNKHWDMKQRSGRGPIGEMAVIGAKQRNGNVIAMLIENTDTQTLEQFISDHIQEGSVICTDDHPGYRNLHHNYMHLTVSHSNGQYVDGLAHTNQIQELATASIPESTGARSCVCNRVLLGHHQTSHQRKT